MGGAASGAHGLRLPGRRSGGPWAPDPTATCRAGSGLGRAADSTCGLGQCTRGAGRTHRPGTGVHWPREALALPAPSLCTLPAPRGCLSWSGLGDHSDEGSRMAHIWNGGSCSPYPGQGGPWAWREPCRWGVPQPGVNPEDGGGPSAWHEPCRQGGTPWSVVDSADGVTDPWLRPPGEGAAPVSGSPGHTPAFQRGWLPVADLALTGLCVRPLGMVCA